MERESIEYQQLTWGKIFKALKKRIKLWLSIFFVGTALSVVLAFVLPKKYESTAVIMPISSTSSGLGSLSDLASLAGLNISGGEDINKIIAILNSRTIRERIIKKLNLIPVLVKKEEAEKRNPINVAIKKLEKKVGINHNKRLGTISISVEDEDPLLAQKIAQAYIDETRLLLNEKKLSVAKFDRIYLEKKLKEEEEKLKKLQKKLVDFQKKTKVIDPDSQLKKVLDIYLSFLSKRTELLLKISSLSYTLSPDNPQIVALKKQISFIDNQLKKLEKDSKFLPSLKKIPDILSEYADIKRELSISQGVYETLMKLYQQAKINESKEQLFIEVIDPPYLPDIPSKPKKKLIVVAGAFLSLIIGILIAVYTECCRGKSEEEAIH